MLSIKEDYADNIIYDVSKDWKFYFIIVRPRYDISLIPLKKLPFRILSNCQNFLAHS